MTDSSVRPPAKFTAPPNAQPTVSNKTLQTTVADLQSVNVWHGCWRFSLLGIAVLSCLTLAWTTQAEIGFWLWTAGAGIFYAGWLICTHDMAHHTLLGRPIVEAILARIISWPMLWPVGVYSELHQLHHGWNGLDLRDPERYQWSEQEYEQASSWVKWYIRHQWIVNIFVLGGLGIVVKTFIDGRRLQSLRPRLRVQWWVDLVGMALVQTGAVTVVVLTQAGIVRYLLFWFCLERVVGAIAQTRAHLEHYGLWHQAGSHQLTQLYASRNLQTSAWFSWLIGGLNYHAVHHAFPQIPFNQLPEAYGRIQAVLADHGMPALEMEQGYPRAIKQLINRFTLIPNNNVLNQ
ncbi:MAG: fatty acid desaturase [Cyanobacteria bacterium P01_H01_bin.105]